MSATDANLWTPELAARARLIQMRMRRQVTDALAGAYRSTFRGSGIEFEEVRPYLPGDDVRSIDWHRTARGQGAYVKTYVEERELTLVFVCDTSPSMDFGTAELSKREAAAQLVTLLAMVAVREEDQVGLVLFDREPRLHLPPRKGFPNVMRVLREVIAPRPEAGPADLAAVLEETRRVLPRRALVFLVSDFDACRGDARDEAWVRPLGRLARRHDVVAVRVLDPFEEELPRAGLVSFADAETGQPVELDTSSPRVRAAWRERAGERGRALAAALRRAQTDAIDVRTDGDVTAPLVRFFRSRRRRGAVA